MKEKEFLLWAKDKNAVTTALESGVKAIIVESEDEATNVNKLGKIDTWVLGQDIEYIKILNKEDEIRAASSPKKVLVETTDWTIIPLENIIAQKEDVYVIVKSEEEAKTALNILEKGVKGVVLKDPDLNLIKRISNVVEPKEKLNLVEAEILRVLPVGMGDRVCVDTTSILKRGEGMLVGNSSGGMLLVAAETEENPYVASRPFRVNAGAVHMYIRTPNNKTIYLCEAEAGKPVMAYDKDGNGRVVYVGRAKIERRPMLLVEAVYNGKKISAVLQNAETIRLVTPDGNLISVVDLKKGDKVLGYIEEAGRHFGMKVEETITEK
mgnify:FL=1